MAEHIVKIDKNGRRHIKVKFHAPIKRFKRVETLKLNGHFYYVHINKYNCVHQLFRSEVVSWKEVEKGKRKVRVPNEIRAIPESEIMNKIRGQHYDTAMPRILAELQN